MRGRCSDAVGSQTLQRCEKGEHMGEVVAACLKASDRRGASDEMTDEIDCARCREEHEDSSVHRCSRSWPVQAGKETHRPSQWFPLCRSECYGDRRSCQQGRHLTAVTWRMVIHLRLQDKPRTCSWFALMRTCPCFGGHRAQSRCRSLPSAVAH